jgi:hypothetical protein
MKTIIVMISLMVASSAIAEKAATKSLMKVRNVTENPVKGPKTPTPSGRYWKDKSGTLTCAQTCPLGEGSGCTSSDLGSGDCCCKSATD